MITIKVTPPFQPCYLDCFFPSKEVIKLKQNNLDIKKSFSAFFLCMKKVDFLFYFIFKKGKKRERFYDIPTLKCKRNKHESNYKDAITANKK